jgi:membrane protease subunit HflK
MNILRSVRAAIAVNFNDSSGGPWGGRGSGGGGGDGQGGGSGGGGPRNPWNQPPDGDRPRGPKGSSTLDEFMRRARNVGGGLPGGGGNPARWVAYGLAALGLLWVVLTSFHQIEPAERGVVTRLGRYSHTLDPGVSWTLPAPIDRVQTIDVQNIRTIDIPGGSGERLVLTGDQNIIDLEYSIGWKIRDPELFFFQSVDPEATIRSVGESAMRAAIANMPLNAAIGSGRNAIEAEVLQQMQAILDGYRTGVQIQRVTIKQTDPPEAVVDAFKEVTAAGSNAQTSVNNARTYAQQIVARAQGDAAAFDRVYIQYKAAPEVTRRRMYYETMERVLSKVDKTIVEAPGVTPYLPLRELKQAPAPTPAPAAGANQ